MCTTTRLNDQKPTQRCRLASSSWPKVLSTKGIRAIRSTWTSNRSEATRPVNRPRLVRLAPACASPWTPPPATHRATTTSIEHHTKTPQASRHHSGTPGRGGEARRPLIRANATDLTSVDLADRGPNEAVMLQG